MTAFYNEIEPYAAQWLRNLIDAGHIAPGVVDERSIVDIKPAELAGYTQCHFFAGIGVWSYALRLTGWPDDRPVWTGSCPCQPFSDAGAGAAFDDERHLWPHWFHLIEGAKPRAVPVFGEQVASRGGLAWLDLVQSDLERAGHAVGAVDLCAAGIGSPHIRQRLFFVADAERSRVRTRRRGKDVGEARGLQGADEERQRVRVDSGECGAVRLMGDPDYARSQRRSIGRDGADQRAAGPTGLACEWVWCRDGKWRPVEPGTFPLAHGAPSRVGRLRAYGNAIVPQVAAAFISAFVENMGSDTAHAMDLSVDQRAPEGL